ncbi:MAG: NepR family anti-sigma factor [Erythrobacter sp.]
MAADGKQNNPGSKHPDGAPRGEAGERGRAAGKSSPEWADSLKQLYDAVVEEQLPDQFLDLLAKLDEQDTPPGGSNGSSSGSSDAR